MKYTPYSHSKIATWQQCPKKFEYIYVQKLPMAREHSLALDRGKLVHLIFEFDRDIEKIKKHEDFIEIKERNLLSPKDMKDCFNIYDEFKKSKPGQQLFSKRNLFKEMPLGLDYDLEIMEFIPKDKETQKNLFLRGYIDSAVISEGEKEDTLILIDWKTGKYKEKQYQTWDQLLWYSLGLFSKMPFDKIILCYAYVEHNKLNLKEVYRSEIEKYKTALYNTVNKIEEDTVFEKHESPLCNWCGLQDHCMKDV